MLIPTSLQNSTLDRLHAGRQGITQTTQLAQASILFPGVTTKVKALIEGCSTCKEFRQPQTKLLLTTDTPPCPWHTVGTDFFQHSNDHNLLLVDYYSWYPEVISLALTMSVWIIDYLMSVFSHAIKSVLLSDNGPQFNFVEFRRFSQDVGFLHTMGSPHYIQSNGKVARGVRTIKFLL